jgi:hypothetical protein
LPKSLPPGSKAGKSSQVEFRVKHRDRDASASGAAELELRLDGERSDRRRERFIWILIVTIFSDCILFKFENFWFADTIISLLSMVALIFCARWLEIPWIVIYLDRIFSKLLGNTQVKATQQGDEEV